MFGKFQLDIILYFSSFFGPFLPRYLQILEECLFIGYTTFFILNNFKGFFLDDPEHRKRRYC